jgi:hypothetical protein
MASTLNMDGVYLVVQIANNVIHLIVAINAKKAMN